MDFIAYAVKSSLLNLMKSFCFPHLQKITPVTQNLAGFDLAKFLDVKPGQPLRKAHRELLLQSHPPGRCAGRCPSSGSLGSPPALPRAVPGQGCPHTALAM